MKKVLILFGKSDWNTSRPFTDKTYQYSYEYFYTLCQQNGIQMYRASYEWYDYEKHIFKHAWSYDRAGSDWIRVENIQPDLIFDKTKARMETYFKKELIAKHYRFINNLQFTRIMNDKIITSLIFHKWSKKSWIVNNPEKLKNTLLKIKSSKFVIKPISESGGRDVQVLEKKEALEKVTFGNDYLIQEFIDSSCGVPGVSDCMHDLRLVLVNDKLVYSYIREPKEGGYLANLSQGGSLKIVPKGQLPNSLAPIIRCANKVFETFNPRIYSIDLMFDESQRPWIVEMNAMPGLFFSPEEKSSMIELYNELIKIFKIKLGV